jgi:hypothetical protein
MLRDAVWDRHRVVALVGATFGASTASAQAHEIMASLQFNPRTPAHAAWHGRGADRAGDDATGAWTNRAA